MSSIEYDDTTQECQWMKTIMTEAVTLTDIGDARIVDDRCDDVTLWRREVTHDLSARTYDSKLTSADTSIHSSRI